MKEPTNKLNYLIFDKGTIIIIIILVCLFSMVCILSVNTLINGEEYATINDHNLQIKLVVNGLAFPTAMDFLGPDDILVLEKDKGMIRRIINGTMLPHPVLDVSVATERERGILGIVVAKNIQNGTVVTHVFIYFTESKLEEDGLDNCPPPRPSYCNENGEPIGNNLYRYEFVNNKLINPKLLLHLPAKPGPNHNGGVLLIGPDNNLYTVIGDVLPFYDDDLGTKATNFRNGGDPDGRSGILRITQDGLVVGNGIIGEKHPLNKYYAYGIRNSFGIDFDPVTGNLWDTENGPSYGDEINLVEPGFNSGWILIQGLWSPLDLDTSENILNLLPDNRVLESDKYKFADFSGKGKYSSPEFIWNRTVGVTALKFLDSEKLGKKYKNDMFVGDITYGNLYHFDLNKNRTALVLKGELADKIVETKKIDQKSIIFGQNFGGITDLEVGPYDGYLYVLSYHDGSIYRVVPTEIS